MDVSIVVLTRGRCPLDLLSTNRARHVEDQRVRDKVSVSGWAVMGVIKGWAVIEVISERVTPLYQHRRPSLINLFLLYTSTATVDVSVGISQPVLVCIRISYTCI